MHGAVKLLIGLLLIIAGVWGYIAWSTAWQQLKLAFWLIIGNIPGIIIIIGIILLLLGFSDLKS